MSLEMLSGSMAFGTYRLRGQECEDSVYEAIKVGYRVIDTAVIYKNHKHVGAAIRKAIKDGLCSRSDLFITTKVFNGDQKLGKDAIKNSMKNALIDLQLEKLDLIILHRWMPDYWKDAWTALQELQQEYVCTHIGVSNYYSSHLELLCGWEGSHVTPSVNQIEISPYHVPHDTIKLCNDLEIMIQAHTPLIKGEKFTDDRLITISKREKISVAQLLLAWSLSKGWCLAVRSHDKTHIAENWSARNIKLSHESVTSLDSFKDHYVTHPNLLEHAPV